MVTAAYTQFGGISITYPDGGVMTFPDDMTNRDRRKLAEWEAQGNVIAPYVVPKPPPPPPPDPRDVKIADLEAAVSALKKAGVLTVAMIDAEAQRIRADDAEARASRNKTITIDEDA